jgi:folate-binding protein YgfZ
VSFRPRQADIPRDYGNPAAEYRAARHHLAIHDRSHRIRLAVRGREPISALQGLLTGSMPSAPEVSGDGLTRARIEYSAVLTAKGRTIADLRVMWGPDPNQEGLFLDVPAAAIEPLMTHLKRYVPPRLAAIEDVSADSRLLTVLGPEAANPVAEVALGSASYATQVEDLAEGDFLEKMVNDGGGPTASALRVARTCDVDTPAWDVFVSVARFTEIWDRLVEVGATPIGAAVWDTLRVEAGRPVYGGDMDESTILSETGLVDRAVDHTKGCYTGQEIIVRIRDRGHVNRSLRGLLFDEGPVPKPGAELFQKDRTVGVITSVVDSPLQDRPIGLGYLHRDVSNGERVTVGSAAGPPAGVRSLGSGWASP